MYTPQIAQIVEQDTVWLKDLNEILDSLGFIEVGASESLKDSTRLFSKLKPDLVLVNISKPDLEGVELIKQLSRSDYSHSHFVAISDLSDRETVMACIESGASHYILKNCDTYEMERRLVNFIQKARFERPVTERIAAQPRTS